MLLLQVAAPSLAQLAPLALIFILILAAAGLTRGTDIFQFLGVGSLLSIGRVGAGGAGKGLRASSTSRKVKGAVAGPYAVGPSIAALIGKTAGKAQKGVSDAISKGKTSGKTAEIAVGAGVAGGVAGGVLLGSATGSRSSNKNNNTGRVNLSTRVGNALSSSARRQPSTGTRGQRFAKWLFSTPAPGLTEREQTGGRFPSSISGLTSISAASRRYNKRVAAAQAQEAKIAAAQSKYDASKGLLAAAALRFQKWEYTRGLDAKGNIKKVPWLGGQMAKETRARERLERKLDIAEEKINRPPPVMYFQRTVSSFGRMPSEFASALAAVPIGIYGTFVAFGAFMNTASKTPPGGPGYTPLFAKDNGQPSKRRTFREWVRDNPRLAAVGSTVYSGATTTAQSFKRMPGELGSDLAAIPLGIASYTYRGLAWTAEKSEKKFSQHWENFKAKPNDVSYLYLIALAPVVGIAALVKNGPAAVTKGPAAVTKGASAVATGTTAAAGGVARFGRYLNKQSPQGPGYTPLLARDRESGYPPLFSKTDTGKSAPQRNEYERLYNEFRGTGNPTRRERISEGVKRTVQTWVVLPMAQVDAETGKAAFVTQFNAARVGAREKLKKKRDVYGGGGGRYTENIKQAKAQRDAENQQAGPTGPGGSRGSGGGNASQSSATQRQSGSNNTTGSGSAASSPPSQSPPTPQTPTPPQTPSTQNLGPEFAPSQATPAHKTTIQIGIEVEEKRRLGEEKIRRAELEKRAREEEEQRRQADEKRKQEEKDREAGEEKRKKQKKEEEQELGK